MPGGDDDVGRRVLLRGDREQRFERTLGVGATMASKTRTCTCANVVPKRGIERQALQAAHHAFVVAVLSEAFGGEGGDVDVVVMQALHQRLCGAGGKDLAQHRECAGAGRTNLLCSPSGAGLGFCSSGVGVVVGQGQRLLRSRKQRQRDVEPARLRQGTQVGGDVGGLVALLQVGLGGQAWQCGPWGAW